MLDRHTNNYLEQCNDIAKRYNDVLSKLEHQDLADRLQNIQNLLSQREQLENIALNSQDINDIFASQEMLNIAIIELTTLVHDLALVDRFNWDKIDRQLWNGRTDLEIQEIEELITLWSPGTYDTAKASVIDHADRKNYDILEYLKAAAKFDKNKAVRIPSRGFRNDGTVRWENKQTNEFLIEDDMGKIRSYGTN